MSRKLVAYTNGTDSWKLYDSETDEHISVHHEGSTVAYIPYNNMSKKYPDAGMLLNGLPSHVAEHLREVDGYRVPRY